jgi:hypothetical protein
MLRKMLATFVIAVGTSTLLATAGAAAAPAPARMCSNQQCISATSSGCDFRTDSDCCVCETATGYACSNISCSESCKPCGG